MDTLVLYVARKSWLKSSTFFRAEIEVQYHLFAFLG